MEQEHQGAREVAPIPDLARLLEEHGDSLLRMCTLYLRDRALAEDAVQDTMLRVMAAWGSFRGECSERTFLTKIAINICKNYLKSPWRRSTAPEEVLDTLVAEPPEPEDDTLVREIMALPRKYREVVVLHYYEALKAHEIAALLDAPISTVTVRLSRARGLLKKRLRGWYYGEE